MSQIFNAEYFEKLQGIQLGTYALELCKDGNLPSNCIKYVRENSNRWDGQHLECG